MTPRSGAIDCLRGAAALAVLARHLGVFEPGYLGVPVFFAVSGWLIGGQLLGGRPLVDYTVARVSRVLPLAWLVAVIGWAAGYAAGAPLWSLLTFQLWTVPPEVMPLQLVVLWTLGVEELCYLTAPLWVGRSTTLGTYGVLACTLWGGFGTWLGAGALAGYHSPLTQAGPFFLGALAAHSPPSSRVCLALVATGIGVLLLGGSDLVDWRLACPAAGLLGTGAVVLASRTPWTWAPLAWIGRRCLGVYLLHPWAILLVPWWAVLPATCLAAEVSWRLIEQPARQGCNTPATRCSNALRVARRCVPVAR